MILALDGIPKGLSGTAKIKPITAWFLTVHSIKTVPFSALYLQFFLKNLTTHVSPTNIPSTVSCIFLYFCFCTQSYMIDSFCVYFHAKAGVGNQVCSLKVSVCEQVSNVHIPYIHQTTDQKWLCSVKMVCDSEKFESYVMCKWVNSINIRSIFIIYGIPADISVSNEH